jgi:hypothetical protein
VDLAARGEPHLRRQHRHAPPTHLHRRTARRQAGLQDHPGPPGAPGQHPPADPRSRPVRVQVPLVTGTLNRPSAGW